MYRSLLKELSTFPRAKKLAFNFFVSLTSSIFEPKGTNNHCSYRPTDTRYLSYLDFADIFSHCRGKHLEVTC